ncbi:hypothetical protein BOX15_Mlig003125g3 [Macrostomum lignano]|uniref:Uncharacterized protein n=2 Tax=Macrostomum lignano TaxID=282301 RepID=A0A267F2M6_9PLAT|nr:hypothetical protein BOX15_Mlig003125g2 [Macrostomum lignano]PAA67427.1 hypothetical protein BOX15_Mlig003125g1 [Macrostomum lignano]PAA79136.1 hypothetical protein BOX15_Mlig003125g3 [Macrostomum lignano]
MSSQLDKSSVALVAKCKPGLWSRQERKQWMGSLLIGSACLYLSRTIMPLCNVPISTELNWSKSTSGMVLGAFFWGYTCTQFLGGYLADRVGGEFVVTMAAFGWAAVTMVHPLLPWLSDDPSVLLSAFLLCRVLTGACQGFHYPGMSSLMAHRVQLKERAYTWSVGSCGAHVGTLLCGSVGSLIVGSYGWRAAFIVIGLCGLTWAFVVRSTLLRRRQRVIDYAVTADQPVGSSTSGGQQAAVASPIDQHQLLLEDTMQQKEREADKLARKLSTESKAVAAAAAGEREGVPWGAVVRSPAFWAMIVGHFAHANSFFILLSWIPTYFHDNFPDARAWVFNVVPWMVTIPASLGSGLLADWLLRKRLSVTTVRKLLEGTSLLLTALFLYLLCHTHSYAQSLACMALAICACGFHNSGILVNPHDLLPAHGGALFGVMNIFGAVPGFVGVYMVGHILETTKSWPAVFLNTAAICVVGAVVYLAFGSGKRIRLR